MAPRHVSGPKSWVLTFRMKKTAVMLDVGEFESTDAIRDRLFETIRNVANDGKFAGHEIPLTSDEIVLGIPVDQRDTARGFQDIQTMLEAIGLTKESDKSVFETPRGLKLKWGNWVAFRFKTTRDHELETDGLTDPNAIWEVDLPPQHGDETSEL